MKNPFTGFLCPACGSGLSLLLTSKSGHHPLNGHPRGGSFTTEERQCRRCRALARLRRTRQGINIEAISTPDEIQELREYCTRNRIKHLRQRVEGGGSD